MFVDYSIGEIEELKLAEAQPKTRILAPAKKLLDNPNAPKSVTPQPKPQTPAEQILKIDMKKLAQICPLKRYTTGMKLYSEGENIKDMFVIVQGKVLITVDGMMMNSLESGDLVGEISFINNTSNNETAEFLTDGVALSISRDNYASAIIAEPALAHKLLNALSVYIQRLLAELEAAKR
jgi:CRP-like cAMP-binding protein